MKDEVVDEELEAIEQAFQDLAREGLIVDSGRRSPLRGFRNALAPLPAAVVCRGTARLLCRLPPNGKIRAAVAALTQC